MSKLIAVFGSTGNQGGSVLRALLKNSDFKVRAITRNANSDKAKKLAEFKNCSVFEADLDNHGSVDNALKDCYGAFLVTDFSAHFDNREVKQGTNFIDCAIKNKVSHVVFSGLELVQPIINKPCLHFDYKSQIEDYGLKFADKINFTSLRMPMFFEAFHMMFYKTENQFILNVPMGNKELYAMSVDDIGECILSIFQNPEKFKSQIVPVAAEYMKLSDYIDILNKHLPVKVVDGNQSLEDHLKFGYPGVEDIVNMFEYYQTGKMTRDIALTKSLNKNLTSFENWVIKNKDLLAKIQKPH